MSAITETLLSRIAGANDDELRELWLTVLQPAQPLLRLDQARQMRDVLRVLAAAAAGQGGAEGLRLVARAHAILCPDRVEAAIDEEESDALATTFAEAASAPAPAPLPFAASVRAASPLVGSTAPAGEPPRRTTLEPHPELGMTAPRRSAQPAAPALPFVSEPREREMTLEQFASLGARLAVQPEHRRTILTSHGLTGEPELAVTQRRWRERFDADPGLARRYAELFEHYEAHLRQAPP